MKNSNTFLNSNRRTSPILQTSSQFNLNNISQGSYFFKERMGPLKWKELMKVDIDLLIKKNNISFLENYLENLIFSAVEENDLQIVSEEHILKLIKMYQHILEYLVHTQQKLEGDISSIENNYTNLVNETVEKDSHLKKNKDLIINLKKDIKEKEAVIKSYKYLIEDFKRKHQSDNYNLKHQNIQYNQVRFPCNLCGKQFISSDALQNHTLRRHVPHQTAQPESTLKNNEDELNMSVVDRKINNLNSNFEKYIKSVTDPMINFVATQKNLEDKINEIRVETKNELGNQVKSILLEIKDMYINNTLVQNQQSSNNNKIENDHNEDILKMTNALAQIKNQLNELKEDNDIKYNKERLSRNMENNFKQTNESQLYISQSIEKKTKDVNNIKVVRPSSSDIQIVKEVREVKSNLNNINKKLQFNSGPLEDDNSDEEKIIIKEKKKEEAIKEKPAEIEIIENKITPEQKDQKDTIPEVQEVVNVEKQTIIVETTFNKTQVEPTKNAKLNTAPANQTMPLPIPTAIIKRNSKDAFEELKTGFNFYMARDQNFQESLKRDNYKPISKEKSKKSVDDKLKALLDKETSKFSNSKGLEELKNEKNLPSLIDTLLKDIDGLKAGENGFFEHYYEEANKLINIEPKVKNLNSTMVNNIPKSQTAAKFEVTNKKLEKINDENNLCKY